MVYCRWRFIKVQEEYLLNFTSEILSAHRSLFNDAMFYIFTLKDLLNAPETNLFCSR